MGAGGSAGKIDFPTHMKEIHQRWFDYTGTGSGNPLYTRTMHDLIELYTKDAGQNPFLSVSYTSPASRLTDVNNELVEFDNKVDALSESTDLTTAFTQSLARVDTANVLKTIPTATIFSDTLTAVNSALATMDIDGMSANAIANTDAIISQAVAQMIALADDTVIAAAVTEFYNKNQLQQGRILRRYAQGMADVNAVQSSAFFFGMAILEAENSRQTAEYSTQLRLQLSRDVLLSYVDAYKTHLASELEKTIRSFVPLYTANLNTRLESEVRMKAARDALFQASLQQWVQMLYNNINSHQAVVASFNTAKATAITATAEHEGNVADLNEKMAEWYFRVYQYGGSLFGAINGSSAVVPARPTKGQSVLAGAAAGMAAGAALGPKGAVAGAVIGGLGALI